MRQHILRKHGEGRHGGGAYHAYILIHRNHVATAELSEKRRRVCLKTSYSKPLWTPTQHNRTNARLHFQFQPCLAQAHHHRGAEIPFHRRCPAEPPAPRGIRRWRPRYSTTASSLGESSLSTLLLAAWLANKQGCGYQCAFQLRGALFLTHAPCLRPLPDSPAPRPALPLAVPPAAGLAGPATAASTTSATDTSRLVAATLTTVRDRCAAAPAAAAPADGASTPLSHGWLGAARGWAPPIRVVDNPNLARAGYDAKTQAHEYLDSPDVLQAKVAVLADLIRRAGRMVAYTGAGISTASASRFVPCRQCMLFSVV